MEKTNSSQINTIHSNEALKSDLSSQSKHQWSKPLIQQLKTETTEGKIAFSTQEILTIAAPS